MKKETLRKIKEKNRKTRSNRKNLGCIFIRVNLDEKDYDEYANCGVK